MPVPRLRATDEAHFEDAALVFGSLSTPTKKQLEILASINTPRQEILLRRKASRCLVPVLLLVIGAFLSVGREMEETSYLTNTDSLIVETKSEMVPHTMIVSAETNSTSSTLSAIEIRSCKPNKQLPKNWCMDEGGTPRYIGDVSFNNLEVKRYNHKGFEQCLANKTVVFIGDSRVRYQLMNLAGFLHKSTFMKCQDYKTLATPNYRYTSADDDCYLIQREFQLGSEMKGNDWTSYYIESTRMIDSNNTFEKQYSLCDCYRKHPFDSSTTYENRFIKRQTAYGEINLIYLQNFEDLIRMNKDYPPYSSFWSNERCHPGECSQENRTDAFSGSTNNTLWEILPKLNASHAFVSSGWGPLQRTEDISCTLESFQKHHPNIEMYLISHPAEKNQKYDKATWFDGNRLECNINSLDRQTISRNAPEEWYSDTLHVLSVLNEEFNHRLIETLCPIN